METSKTTQVQLNFENLHGNASAGTHAVHHANSSRRRARRREAAATTAGGAPAAEAAAASSAERAAPPAAAESLPLTAPLEGGDSQPPQTGADAASTTRRLRRLPSARPRLGPSSPRPMRQLPKKQRRLSVGRCCLQTGGRPEPGPAAPQGGARQGAPGSHRLPRLLVRSGGRPAPGPAAPRGGARQGAGGRHRQPRHVTTRGRWTRPLRTRCRRSSGPRPMRQLSGSTLPTRSGQTSSERRR